MRLQVDCCRLVHAALLFSFLVHPEDAGDMFLRSIGFFSELHGVITQKAVLFLTRRLFGLFEDTSQHSPYVDN
jgi:hypothetical protein